MKTGIALSLHRNRMSAKRNKATHRHLSHFLEKHLGSSPVKIWGGWNGARLQGLFFPDSPTGRVLAVRLCRRFNQESCLVVKPSGVAFLLHTEGSTERLPGTWQQVQEDEVSTLPGWTYFPSTNSYYAVK